MLYIAIFFLVFYTPWFSECNFIPKSLPIHPKLGEDVLLACKLTAPDGYQFSGTVPDLTTSNIDHQFDFDEIQSKFGDNRYHGWSIRDSSSTYLQGFISIFSLNESDLSINFTCFQYVENDTVISASLILADFVQNTSTPPAMVTDSVDSSVKTASTNYSDSTVPTTGCPPCSPIDCTWEIATIGIFIVAALLSVPCFCACFFFKGWITKTKLYQLICCEKEYRVDISPTVSDVATPHIRQYSHYSRYNSRQYD